jgi:hypothetical protein
MQFSSIVTSLIAAAGIVSAAATPQSNTVGRRAVKDVEVTAKSQVAAMEANGCDIFGKSFEDTIQYERY